MVIGIDASRANREHKSGVEWYAYHLLRNFYKLDVKNQYFLYSDRPLEVKLKNYPANFTSKVLNWPLPRFWTMGRLTLEMLHQRPDILFVPSHTLPFIGGKKNIITWHDIGYERYPETYNAWELASLKQGARRAYKLADKIITVSNFTKNEIITRHNVPEERIEVIYLGCNHQRWQPVAAEQAGPLLQQLNLTLPYFIYVGRLALRKNIIGLIRIYNRFREKYKSPHNLILVGPEGTYQNEINEEIKASPFKNEIKKLGWLNIDDLPALVSQAKALIYPSIYEGFGLPVLEAMSTGCPVIVSTAGSLPEIVGSAGLQVDAPDIEGFAAAMIKILEDQQLRQSLIERGSQRAANFTWENCAGQTLKVFESV